MKERIYWVDYLKAFTMFLVVLGHSGLDDDSFIKSWIYGFHMPLFVFVSGYFVKKPVPVLVQLKKDVRALCVPYLFFSVFLIPFFFLIQRLAGESISENLFLYIGKRLLMDDYYRCGPIWFLGALFVIKTFCNAVLEVAKKESRCYSTIIPNIIVICAIIVIAILGLCFDLHLFSVMPALALLPFYIAGMFCQHIIQKLDKRKILTISILSLILYSYISIHNKGIDYDQLKLGNNIAVTYFEGFLGCFSMTFLFSCFSKYKSEFIRNVGMNTLTILGFHAIFIQIFRFIYKYAFTEVIPLWYLVCLSILSFFICYFVSFIIIRICPQAIGQKHRPKD